VGPWSPPPFVELPTPIPPYDPSTDFLFRFISTLNWGIPWAMALTILLTPGHAGETDQTTTPGEKALLLAGWSQQYGGHALDDHAAWLTPDQLKDQITSRGKSTATAFNSQREMGGFDRCRSGFGSGDIQSWAANAASGEDFVLTYDAGRNVGHGYLDDGPNGVQAIASDLTLVRIVRRSRRNGEYVILTVYPSNKGSEVGGSMKTEEAREILVGVALRFEDFGNEQQQQCAYDLAEVLLNDPEYASEVREALEHFLSGVVSDPEVVSLVREEFNRAIWTSDGAKDYLRRIYSWIFETRFP
jgi:hypothetical protein